MQARLLFAENIRREMDVRGWSQSELSRRSGVPQPRISQILAAHRDCQLSTIDRLADAFGLTASALLAPPADFLNKAD